MLTPEDRELLIRTGPGTPMGEMMRRYWIPALLAEELPAPDCDPIRVRLLGEDLVAFRDTDGRIGILDQACAHRCASLVYGRNEQGGLRCIYHGWKYDVFGNVLETPAEPAESSFKDRIKLRACATRELGGVIWTYMGPPEKTPVFPEWEWTHAPEGQVVLSKTIQDCNYLQALEGDIDSSHSDYLHSSELRGGRPRDHAPRLQVQDTAYGFRYAAIRKPDEAADTHKYVRTTLFVAPFHTFIPPRRPRISGRGGVDFEYRNHHVYVPTDDEHHIYFSFLMNRVGPANEAPEFGPKVGYRPPGHRGNQHLQDRAAIKAGSWSGITGIRNQDRAVTESMGPITPHHKEHLGSSDMAVAYVRLRMLNAVKAFRDGAEPLGIDPGIPYERIRSEELVVPIETPWQAVGAFAGEPVPVA